MQTQYVFFFFFNSHKRLIPFDLLLQPNAYFPSCYQRWQKILLRKERKKSVFKLQKHTSVQKFLNQLFRLNTENMYVDFHSFRRKNVSLLCLNFILYTWLISFYILVTFHSGFLSIPYFSHDVTHGYLTLYVILSHTWFYNKYNNKKDACTYFPNVRLAFFFFFAHLGNSLS